MNQDTPFYTSLFTKSIFKRENPKSSTIKRGSIVVATDVPTITPSQTLILVGSCKKFGEWDSSRGIKMMDGEFPRWESPSIKFAEEVITSEYKFAIIDSASGNLLSWEDGPNRRFDTVATDIDYDQEALYMCVESPRFNVPAWRGVGVAIPVFSLRSEESMGVGDFMDLKKMVDWAASTGQKIIQILPINDSTMTHTWEDSYPYNANSIFALHPQFLSLKRAGELRDKEMQSQMEAEGAKLNALEKIDYVGVTELKERYMRQLYSEVGKDVLSSKEFKSFLTQNSYWLEPYALYSLLRDRYNTVNFEEWGEAAQFSEALLKKYTSKRCKSYQELAYYYFVQYNLHIQLVEAREYAQSKGVAFKGDIPIGVSRTSADVWVTPKLFHLNSQAGAPPDDFSVLGQNWGFPTYDWKEMAKDGYAWWSARFKKMAEYFDAYRIDHILGFFRIWEIPLDAVHGLLGHFSPALPYSVAEIEAYGFKFDKAYTTPDINDWIVAEMFGERAEEVKTTFLKRKRGSQIYTFKEEYDTQLKILRGVSDETLHLPLMSLLNEVLFIEDPYKRGKYHPRISAQGTYKYRAMNSHDKANYDNLYNNFYYHRHNDFWFGEAMAKLPALVAATEMLTCGEDLGMIPDCVPEVMERLDILSLEIQRMPKDPGVTFGQTRNYQYPTVCTTSTHDMTPIRAWLLEDAELSRKYVNEVLNISPYDPTVDPSPQICEEIIRQHLDSPAMWTILPLQDWLSVSAELRCDDPISERINIPASSRHYWRYRMHITLEKLIEAAEFNTQVLRLVSNSGR
ncbi:MAG: 4-alpha-glucanotransferase [Rikenellaceae bacterium]